MKCVVLILVTMFTWSKHVVASTPEWNVGTVVLNDLQILTGEIVVEQKHDLVLIKQGDHVDVVAAHRLRSVNIYDKLKNINRRFVSVSTRTVNRNRFQLFEVVLNGEVSVLRKMKDIASKAETDADDFEYFVYANERLTALRKFRSTVYQQLVRNRGNEISRYIKEEKLNPNLAAHAILIVDHYNQIVRNDLSLSRR